MPNFPFTSVGCPDAKCCQLVPTLARTLRSYLDSCHQLAVHQPSIRCDRAPTPTHPLPNSNFAPLPTGDGWPNTASFARIPTQAADATSDTVGPSPRWHEPPHHHPARPSAASRTGASHSSHQPALRRDPRTNFTASAPTSPLARLTSATYLLPRQDQAHGTRRAGAPTVFILSRCRTSDD